MRILFSLLSFLFTLGGCNHRPGVTTLSLSSVDGVDINSTQARISAGDARFECLKSATGSCHYVVFLSACGNAGDPATQEMQACKTRVIERFTLAAGTSRELQGLPAGIKHCQDHEAMPVAPDCRKG